MRLVCPARAPWRTWLLVVLAAPTACAPAVPPADEPAFDRAAIEAVLLDLPTAWNARDADAWVARFAADSEFTNILGMPFADRDANRERHAQLFETIFADSELDARVLSIRPVGTGGAVAVTEFTLAGYGTLPPDVEETEPGVLRTRLMTVFEHQDGAWRIVAAQNTAILPAAVGN